MALRLLQEQLDGIREPGKMKENNKAHHKITRNNLSMYLLTPGTTDYARWLKRALYTSNALEYLHVRSYQWQPILYYQLIDCLIN